MRHFTFNALSDVGWLALLVLAGVAAAVCVVWLYRYEQRLVPRRLGVTLLTLRLLVVGVVFLTLLEPVLTWTLERTRTGRVRIALDVSDSMSTADTQADKSERLRWLRALKMIGNKEVDARLDRWQEAFDNDREPEWVSAEESLAPRAREELASARKQQLEELMADVGQLPRKEIARRLISSGPASLLRRIDELAETELEVFAGEAAFTDAASLEALVEQPDESLKTDASDLFAAISAEAAEASASPLVGIILFTDGRDTAAVDGTQLLGRLRGLPAPVYPVMIGSQQRPRDLALGVLDYPEMVYQNDAAIVRAAVRAPGFDGEPVTVTLQPLDQPEHAQTRTVTGGDGPVDVEFPLDASQLGRRKYAIRIDPQPGETRDDNNEKRFVINVVDDETRVLVMDGAARWEFRFLDNALTRDPRVKVDRVVFRQPYLGILPETFFPRTLTLPDDQEEALASPFAPYDAVIIGDIAPAHLPPRAWELLDRFVRDEGGTLVMTAGKEHFPRSFSSEIVRRLLPVEDLKEIELAAAEQLGPPTLRGFQLTLTPDGTREEFLQFDADPLENARIWDALPGHAWGLVGRLKPGATVLAALRDKTGPGGLDFERAHAVIAQQYAGAGQVLWIGIDSTWRWRHRVGDRWHHRFWGQITRWAARFKASAGNEFVRFGPERSEITVGEDALLRARWNQRFLNQFPNLQARAEFFPVNAPDDAPPVMSIDLEPTDTRPLIHEGKASSLEAGEYRVRLAVSNADLGPEPITAELSVTERLTTELAELAADRNLLEQIADVTGGRLFLPDEIDALPDLFTDVTKHTSSRELITLWDHWLILAVCFTLLTTEWVTRKLNGLP